MDKAAEAYRAGRAAGLMGVSTTFYYNNVLLDTAWKRGYSYGKAVREKELKVRTT